LVELVNRYQNWKSKQKPSKNNSPSKTLNRQAGGYDAATITGNGTVRTEWNFDDTIRGTRAGMPVELDLGALDDEEEWDLENEEVEVWDGTTKIKQGAVVGGALNTLNVSAM
jgi:serine/threonine-protein kinase 24/25/MST4